MLSDSQSKYLKKGNRPRAINAPLRRWSDSQKIDAIVHYIATGSLSAVSRTTKIPEETIRTWKRSNWWKELERDLRKQEKLQLSGRLKSAMTAGFDIIKDRLENGDWIYNQKTGELLRKPVSMKDAAKVTMDAAALDLKIETAEAMATSAVQIESELHKLAEAFTAFTKGTYEPPVEMDTLEMVDIIEKEEGNSNAIYEEREEGLQERE